MSRKALLCEAEAQREYIVRHRRYLHENAEVGFELKNTVEYVKKELEALNCTPNVCGKCGIFADIGKGERCILLRADMDALPIQEESGVPFASQNGNMHACGHDMHTSMLLGAAKLLKAHESELPCRARLMFQPAEEILEGAKDMIGAGVLDSVDAAIMIHVAAALDLPTGAVIIPSAGVGAPSADHFSVTVMGKGAHGATPNLGADAILSGAHILLGFSDLISRELSICERAVLTIGRFDGGDAANAIADRASLKGTFRTFDEGLRKRIKARMTDITQAIAKAYLTEAELNFTNGCPSLYNDESIAEHIKICAKDILGKENVLSAAELDGTSVGGSEDFAYISRRVPTAVLSLVAGEKKKGYEYPLHHPKVRFDEAALPFGAALLAGFALSFNQKRG